MVRIVARCVHGLEWAAAAEIARVLGVEGRLARREIGVDLPALTERVLDLRCCDDVFLLVGAPGRVGSTKADLPAIARDLARLDWAGAVRTVVGLRPEPPATFDCVASLEGRHSYSRYAVEDAVGAALAPGLGLRPLSRADGDGSGDLTVRLFVRDAMVTAALRIAPRPLHRRPWKLDTGPGTLHPPLAAALVTLLADGPVHDPFCGDGTLAIEAALAGHPATAADLDPARVSNAHANAARAGAAVTVHEADAADLGRRDGVVLTNPPWDRSVQAGGRATLGSFLDAAAGAAVCLLTDAELDVPAELRRRGVTPTLATRLRVGGRLADVTLAGMAVPADLARRREEAIRAGVVTEHGF